MRVTVGAFAVLGFAVAVAGAQPTRERAAVLKPPQAIGPDDAKVIARGVADDFPNTGYLQSTPVARTANAPVRPLAANSPPWLAGVDAHVLPASGTGTKQSTARQLSPGALASGMPGDPPPQPPKNEPSAFAKGMDKLKSIGGDKSAPRPPANMYQQQQEYPTAATPFRATGTNGAPVYAGPPAYRWYGWGTVTPGANPLAPTGQYPKASAAWYSITGATPGAFPVPVSGPTRGVAGIDPPNYQGARPQPQPQPYQQPVMSAGAPPVRPHPVERTEPPKFVPPSETKFLPAPGTGSVPPPPAPPVSVPTITAPPAPKPVAVVPPPPAPVTVKETQPIPVPTMPEPVGVAPPIPTLPVVPSVEAPKPVPVAAEEKPVRAAPPAPLPPALTEEPQWQPTKAPAQPQPGTWAPAGTAPQPPKAEENPPAWQGSKANVGPVVARAQMPDTKPDPIAALIRAMCRDRADGVEVRWTGTKKLSVCFETRTAAEAQKLVSDISKRPELGPYEINYCVVVK